MRLGDFELGQKLGGGGMGDVFLARQLSLGRHVAMKVPHAQFAQDETFRRRFLREARNAARITSPYVVQVYAVGEEGGTPYLAMEYVRGETLGQRLARGRLAPHAAVQIGIQVCEALTEAHEFVDPDTGAQGIIHRDVKPENIFLEAETGRAKLGDFGLSRATGDVTVTAHKYLTPAYASPEQCFGGETDHRTDIYSLGLVLYEMLTGRCLSAPPSEDAVAIPYAVTQQATGRPPPAPHELDPSVPPALSGVVLTALAPRPADRFQSARELAEALRTAATAPAPVAPASSPQVVAPTPGIEQTAQLPVGPRRRRSAALWAVPLLLFVLAAGAGSIYALMGRGSGAPEPLPDPEPQPEPQPQPQPPPQPQPSRPVAREIVKLRAESSSVLRSPSGRDYGPHLAVDRDEAARSVTDTAWNARSGDLRPSLQIWLPGTFVITRVDLIPGYAKRRSDQHGDRWIRNNRLKTFRLMFPDGIDERIKLEDSTSWGYCSVDLKEEHRADHFTIRVEEVFRAEARYRRSYGDTCVSDVRVWGYPVEDSAP